MPELLDLVRTVAPGGGLVALVTFAVLAVWRGWLVPRSSVDALIAVQTDRLAEAREREREWRAAWQASEEARRILAGHVADVVDSLRTVEAVVRGLPSPERPGRGGGM